jgi:hypothetical protein
VLSRNLQDRTLKRYDLTFSGRCQKGRQEAGCVYSQFTKTHH